ncbi:MAG: hypothetical protein QMB51_01800, partial [Patescibacteria group bacterium]
SLDVEYYISQLKGDWFDEDFSGLAIPTKYSINRNTSQSSTSVSYWWKGNAYGSNSILSSNPSKASTVICKSYPETNSPFNFIDRFQYELCYKDSGVVKVNDNVNNGNIKCVKDKDGNYFSLEEATLTYDQYKALTPKDYFKNVYGSITVPYSTATDAKALYRIDNKQDCYYQKVNYKDLSNPREQYFGKGQGDLPANVCYDSSGGGVKVNSDNTCFYSSGSGLESKVADYTSTTLKYKGYCAEYDYSHEIYYSGSGKYNCLTWIPGFINEGK